MSPLPFTVTAQNPRHREPGLPTGPYNFRVPSLQLSIVWLGMRSPLLWLFTIAFASSGWLWLHPGDLAPITNSALKTPSSQGVALVASPPHPWFGITMQCWDDKGRFRVQYTTENAGDKGWEQALALPLSVQVQAKEGDPWTTLSFAVATGGVMTLDESKVSVAHRWFRNKRASAIRLVAPDSYTSTSQRIGYENTCTGGA